MAEYFDHFRIGIKGSKGRWTERISSSSFYVGRVKPCELVLDAPFVSRKHARIFVEGGGVWIEDLGSSNGVFVNGTRLEPNLSHPLNLNETVVFGEKETFELTIEVVTSFERPAGDDIKSKATHAIGKFSEVLDEGLHLIKLKVERKERLINKVKNEAKVIMDSTRQEREKVLEEGKKEAKKLVDEAKNQAKELIKKAEEEAEDQRKLQAKELKKHRENIESHQQTIENLEKQIQFQKEKVAEGEEALKKTEALLKEQESTRKTLDDLQVALKKVENSVFSEEKKLESISAKESDLQTSVKILNESILEKETEIKKHEGQIISLEQRVQGYEEEKTQLRKIIDELLIEKSQLRSEIDGERKKIEIAKKEAEEERSALLKATHKQVEKEKEELLSETHKKIEMMLLETKEQVQSQISLSREEAHKILGEAKGEAEQIERQSQQKKADLMEQAEREAENILSKARLSSEELIRNAKDEAEGVKLKKLEMEELVRKVKSELDEKKQSAVSDLEEELLSLRAKKLAAIEVEQKEAEERYQIFLRSEAEEIQRKLHEVALTQLKPLLESGTSSQVDKILSQATKSVLLGVDFDEEELEQHLKEKPLEKQKEHKRFFYRSAGLGVLLIAFLFSLPRILDQVGESARDLASEKKEEEKKVIEEIEAQREELAKFEPEVKESYEESYTDRVLHLKGYVENELEASYRERWIVSLNDHLVANLGLNEDIVVAFIAQEANLIRELQSAKETINGQLPEPGIKRMREIEQRFMNSVKSLAGSKKNLNKILTFKEKFYKENSGRGTASEEGS